MTCGSPTTTRGAIAVSRIPAENALLRSWPENSSLLALVNLLQAPHADGVAPPGSHRLGRRARAAHRGDAGHPIRDCTTPDRLLIEECRRACRGVNRQLDGARLQQIDRVGAPFVHLEHHLASKPRRAQHRSRAACSYQLEPQRRELAGHFRGLLLMMVV